MSTEPEQVDPTQCSGDPGPCPEHGFHRESLKQPGEPELAAFPSVPAAADLRERIAQALADNDGWVWAEGFDKTRSPSFQGYLRAADAVLAVLPAPADRYRTAWLSARNRANVLSAEVTRRAPLLGEYASEIERLRAELETARKVEASDTERLTHLEGENARLRADRTAVLREAAAEERLARVTEWVTSDVVTARNEFGNGYREAQRDIRDLLAGRRMADEAQQAGEA